MAHETHVRFVKQHQTTFIRRVLWATFSVFSSEMKNQVVTDTSSLKFTIIISSTHHFRISATSTNRPNRCPKHNLFAWLWECDTESATNCTKFEHANWISRTISTGAKYHHFTSFRNKRILWALRRVISTTFTPPAVLKFLSQHGTQHWGWDWPRS